MLHVSLSIGFYTLGYGGNTIEIEYPVAGGSEESNISSQGGAGFVWELSEK